MKNQYRHNRPFNAATPELLELEGKLMALDSEAMYALTARVQGALFFKEWTEARDSKAYDYADQMENTCLCPLLGGHRTPHLIPCADENARPLFLDHPMRFVKNGVTEMITGQPYGPLNCESLERLAVWCRANDLKCLVSARSWWWPGWTFVLTFTRAESPVVAEKERSNDLE